MPRARRWLLPVKKAVAILFLSLLLLHSAESFVRSIPHRRWHRQRYHGAPSLGMPPASFSRIPHQSQLSATMLSATSLPALDEVLLQDELADMDSYDIATILLELLVQRYKDENDNSFEAGIRRLTQSYKTERKRQARKIEILMEELQQYYRLFETSSDAGLLAFLGTSKRKFNRPAHTYDVTESLLASGFFCTLYWYMPNFAGDNAPKPIWEQVSLKQSNIKGQQYYERNDFEEAVINYSEIWGQDVFLTAQGTFTPIDGIEQSTGTETDPSPRNGLKRIVADSRTLRTCPDVFRVDATKVTLHWFGMKFDLPIRGSSNLVILYADPRIRIFVSPMESKTAVGNWEEAGLVVAQVRSDLVLGEPVIDLR